MNVITPAELETFCQWAHDVPYDQYECVHGVKIDGDYLREANDITFARGVHKTETIGGEGNSADTD